LPIGGKVVDVVLWDFASNPFQKFFLGTGSRFDLDLVSKDDGPNETHNESSVTIANVVSSDGDKFDTLSLQKVEGCGQIFELLDSHLWVFVDFNFLGGNDFEEGTKQLSV